MRMKKISTLLFVFPALFLFFGCPGVLLAAKTPAFKQLAGDVTEHAASGMRFPASVGGFKRVGVHEYDETGNHVSVGYNLNLKNTQYCLIAATVYVSPSPKVRSFGSRQNVVDSAKATLFKNLYEENKRTIIRTRPNVKLLIEKASPPPNQSKQPEGMYAKFSYKEDFGEKNQPVESHLYLYCYVGGNWTVKYRITLRENTSVEARQELDRFLKNFEWTITAKK